MPFETTFYNHLYPAMELCPCCVVKTRFITFPGWGPCTTADLYIRILYTCSVQDELDHQTALHALDLAHRWQVDVVVAILTDLLAGAQAALH